jgi:nitroimidazol reductase NimA-like FMN-containing flavoprotein (pyridoxamine 5'-phosphate oxidase superfamily)
MTFTANMNGSHALAEIAVPLAGEIFELNRAECLSLLAETRLGRLAVSTTDRTPIIRPVSYCFDARSQSVVFRTAVGSKVRALLDAGKATFEIDGIDQAGSTGWSVIVSGVTEEITGQSEIQRLASIGLEPWAPGHTHRWVRIRAFTVSGRRISRNRLSGTDAAASPPMRVDRP